MKKHKRIGILGGISPQSTKHFYDAIISLYHKRYGDHSYPEIVIFSVNFQNIIDFQEENDRENYINELMRGIESLAAAQCDFAVIASNTPHLVFNELQTRSSIPLLSIIEHTAEKAYELKLNKLLVLGTQYTMRSGMYTDELKKRNISAVSLTESHQKCVNTIIFHELVKDIVTEKSREDLINIINEYNVDGIILGCTELEMIIKPVDVSVAVLDTLQIHVEKTLAYAINIEKQCKQK